MAGGPLEKANDGATLRRLRHEIEAALHESIETEPARRVGGGL
ncbi:MAG TPA: hypothetical protein VFS00_07555 [Polyangiaceae bacterium]|nr:hypothetical protein [Polyangiaceae bacterium]